MSNQRAIRENILFALAVLLVVLFSAVGLWLLINGKNLEASVILFPTMIALFGKAQFLTNPGKRPNLSLFEMILKVIHAIKDDGDAR